MTETFHFDLEVCQVSFLTVKNWQQHVTILHGGKSKEAKVLRVSGAIECLHSADRVFREC
jgi:hypothetical protein